MTKLQKILFLGFLIVILGIFYLEATKKQPVNWFVSYHRSHKIPYGTYILHQLLEDAVSKKLINTNLPPYEELQDSSFQGTYVFINNQINFDKTEIVELLKWVDKGNQVFISSNYISKKLLDTLNLEKKTAFLKNTPKTEVLLNLVNPKLKSNSPFHIKRDVTIKYFNKIDTLNHTVLGVSQVFNDTLKINKPLINFLKIPLGDGIIYLHTQPEIFTNYFLLENEQNLQLTQGVLSYLNKTQALFWDTHYKSGKPIQTSPLYILLNNKYLKWSYYLVLIGILIFVLFEGKRKQRSIPIIKPLTNRTYQYTQTISGMYLDKNEHHQIALKQITLFFEYLRNHLRLSTERINTRFINLVATRSGNSLEDTQILFKLIHKIQQQHNTQQEELIELNKKITTFKNR